MFYLVCVVHAKPRRVSGAGEQILLRRQNRVSFSPLFWFARQARLTSVIFSVHSLHENVVNCETVPLNESLLECFDPQFLQLLYGEKSAALVCVFIKILLRQALLLFSSRFT